jgi:hypothetical protein
MEGKTINNLHIVTLIHTETGRIASAPGVCITPSDMTLAERITCIKRSAGTHVIVSHYPHKLTTTDMGIRVDLTGCRYHIQVFGAF